MICNVRRKWRIWKEAEEKLLRECGVDEATIEQIRTDDRADFNSNRRFYRWASDFGEYLEGMADREKQTEVRSVSDLLKLPPHFPKGKNKGAERHKI